MLSLLSVVVLGPSVPVLITVMNPNDGKAWGTNGSPVEPPLPKTFVEEAGRVKSGWKPADRLFVFRYRWLKDGWASGDVPPAHMSDWPYPFTVNAREVGDGNFLVLARETKEDETTANFDVTYTCGPKHLLIDLKVEGGEATIVRGGAYRPRLYASMREAEADSSQAWRDTIRREWPFERTTKAAFSYDTPDGGWLISHNAFRKDGSRVVGWGGWSVGRRYFMPIAESADRLGRCVLEVTPTLRLPIRGVPVNPSPNG